MRRLVGRAYCEHAFSPRADFDESVNRAQRSCHAEFVAERLCDLLVCPAALPKRAYNLGIGLQFAGRRARFAFCEEVRDSLIEAHACADLVNRGDSGRFLAYSGEIEGGPGERLNDLELAGKGPYAVRPFPGVSNDAILSLDILRLIQKTLESREIDNVHLGKGLMFTMAKIRDGSTYLDKHLTANDYYCENEAVAGRWIGRGAERLGLSGKIHGGDDAFETLRNNRHPSDGSKLTPRDSDERIRFYDFQCSAQKSVSVMAVTMGDDRLLAAHDCATAKAFSELERFAAAQANSALSRENRITENVIAAQFRHTASRALDPQVHTHFVTANATWDHASGSWRALTEFEMLKAIRYAGKVYQNELASSCRELGYRISEVRDDKGRITGFEIDGVSKEVCDRFSKRRAEVENGIEAFKQSHGRAPTVAEVHAITVDTRNLKMHERTTPEVLAAQKAQLKPDEWTTLLAMRRQAEANAAQPAHALAPSRERESLRHAIGHIFEKKSVSVGHEVLAEALNLNLGHLDLARLKGHASKSRLVGLDDASWLRGNFSTMRGLALERWAVSFVGRTKGSLPALGQCEPGALASLSPEQQKAVGSVLASKDQVVCLRGAAGVGKTTVLREINSALRNDGRTVLHCAPTTSAADTLRKEGLVDATTVSDFLANGALKDRERLPGAVLVVDEAGLASNAQGAEILRLAERHGMRIVFLGDSKQHTAVEAGDFLRILETHSPIQRVEITEIRRQIVKEYRDAIKLMAVGQVRSGLERLDALGCIHEGRAGYLKGAAASYLEHSSGGRDLGSVIAVTPTWAENQALTEILRTDLKTQGILQAGESVVTHESLGWTNAQKTRAKNYEPGLVVRFNRANQGFRRGEFFEVSRSEGNHVWVKSASGERRLPLCSDFDVSRPQKIEVCIGDRLLIRANDRRAGLINGQILTVSTVQKGTIETLEGRRIDTAKFREFAYGFAVTSHKAQSKTADHVIVAAERLSAKAAYVACSRGRQSCSIHTPDKTNLLARLPDGNRAAALDILPRLGRGSTEVASRQFAWGKAVQMGAAARDLPGRISYATRFHWWRGVMRNVARWMEHAVPGRGVDRAAIERTHGMEL
jgi:conjugative relaxase-like TrwC/TraI family protein